MKKYPYKNNRVVAYLPRDGEGAETMGPLRRTVWFYTNKLGLEFNLVLCLSFIFQLVIAGYIGFKGMLTLPVLADITAGGGVGSVIATVVAVVTALFMQSLIIAELAQVVWLRHPDKLKVRLQSGSVWWWLMLIALILSCVLNFLLLFLSVTGKENLGAAWRAAGQSQLSGFVTLLLCLLSILTMLRCASVMKTSTSAEIRREVKEKLEAIATEMLLDAGEATRSQAMQLWASLSVNPAKFVPLQESVLKLLSEQYPDIVPPDIIGDSWAYDVGGNALARVPPALHHALLQTRHRAAIGQGADYDYLWKLAPSALAELIAYNLESLGAPKYIDATVPNEPRFLTGRRANLARFEQSSLNEVEGELVEEDNLGGSDTELSEGQQFAARLKPAQRVQFGLYLTEVVFPSQNNDRSFPTDAGVSIYECFDLVELNWYWREWQNLKNG